MNELILIYGAGGVQGAPVAHELLARGYRVRTLVRDIHKHHALSEAGADVVAGDLGDLDSLRRASQGVQRVSLLLPFSAPGDPLALAQNALTAAHEAGVELLVLNTSGQTPAEPTGLPMLDARLHLEEMVRGSGVPHIILRPTAYMENLLGPWVLPRLHSEGVLAYPVSAHRPVSWIAAQEMGRLMAAALERPELSGRAFDVGGPQALTGDDLAREFSQVLGREIRYEAISPEAFGAVMGQMMGPQAEADIVAAYRASEAAPPDAVVVDMRAAYDLLPAVPISLMQWATTHAPLLRRTEVRS
ncbi:SDR family oxidoreductase [Deinococcus ruber]|uniref:NmrA family transcriptional regulator n=1 Tax=Deinococcus ruber TaxID=1848197 RepID=A0A918CGX6_9DEIO|nr:NmrA family NAD(P)-binding protein [Deinococcus ruber]GGR22230.1 NmrA family transcriptional regulator [Deinococcus ruber]